MTIYGVNMDGLGIDSRQAKIKRATFGALYGFLGGLAFVLMATFVDILLNPDLPYGVNWRTFAGRLPLITLGLAFVGAVTCWWHEAWQGLLRGAVVASALELIVSLFTVEIATGLKFMVLIFILVPVAAMTLPIAYTLRWLTERHATVARLERSSVHIARLMILVLVLGAACGYFMRIPAYGVKVARFMQGLLQNPAQEKNPLVKIEGVLEHQDVLYKIYQQKSAVSTVGYDFRFEYEDGFTLRCAVIAYPGTDPIVSSCETDQQK